MLERVVELSPRHTVSVILNQTDLRDLRLFFLSKANFKRIYYADIILRKSNPPPSALLCEASAKKQTIHVYKRDERYFNCLSETIQATEEFWNRSYAMLYSKTGEHLADFDQVREGDHYAFLVDEETYRANKLKVLYYITNLKNVMDKGEVKFMRLHLKRRASAKKFGKGNEEQTQIKDVACVLSAI